ncbi:DNA-binding bromodomain-containing family protein [Hibiscus syriacus]|uniref:DNA-binding bromodomain-containing family protein n=1 Tax=Hibiscus syriacus TaxID=106335 RepID=A0A6A2Z5E2_HIBSY|nr:DNA-binding bromodomain-containing family protein [Hibiscus syriacus]
MSDQFSTERLLDFLDLSSEHVALEISNRVEASTYVSSRKSYSKLPVNSNRSTTKSSWKRVKEVMVDGDTRECDLMLCLKQRFTSLMQTTSNTSKIKGSKVRTSNPFFRKCPILPKATVFWFRMLSKMSLAPINDLLYVDDLTKHCEKLSSEHTTISSLQKLGENGENCSLQPPKISIQAAHFEKHPFRKDRGFDVSRFPLFFAQKRNSYPCRFATQSVTRYVKPNLNSAGTIFGVQKRWASQAKTTEDDNKISIGPQKGRKDEEDEKEAGVVYYGPISSTIKKVKMLSLSTCCLSVSLGPVITFMTSPDMNAILKGAVASSVIFLSATTTGCSSLVREPLHPKDPVAARFGQL